MTTKIEQNLHTIMESLSIEAHPGFKEKHTSNSGLYFFFMVRNYLRSSGINLMMSKIKQTLIDT